MSMLLAGDVGGTKTLLGLFAPATPRPSLVAMQRYGTGEFPDIGSLLSAFLDEFAPAAVVSGVALGVAGPVLGRTAALTNHAWTFDAGALEARLGLASGRAALLNDLEAIAYGVPVLGSDDVTVVQAGVPNPNGNVAVIAAGTGLGQASLVRHQGRLIPMASEGGHADFAARTDEEFDVVRMLRARLGRAEVEQVLSGPGIVNLHNYVHDGSDCTAVEGVPLEKRAASISAAALTRRCGGCERVLRLFVSIYGAEAGNLAMRSLATGGLFVAGGIAPRILPAILAGGFMRAFLDKAPMADLLARVPVSVITTTECGLLGAAVYAQLHTTAAHA
jgi:glucokinase